MQRSQTAAYETATHWLYDRINYEKLAKPGTRYRFTLDRMRDLVDRLGHADRLTVGPSADESHGPSREFTSSKTSTRDTIPKIVHIAGTKGKGSVATMMATMLTAAGNRVGLYTSPHLVNLEERFRVDGQPASREEMVDLIESMRPIVDAMTRQAIGGPSFFELTTAIAIEHFARNECHHWVLETGLGGRLDSTNVFQSDVTLITSIGLDHQHVLGNTLQEIAKEKAGILKPGVPAVSGVSESPAREVITQRAQEVGCPLIQWQRDFDTRELPPLADSSTLSSQPWGSEFELLSKGNRSESAASEAPLRVRLSLEGSHQIRNAAVAIAGLRQIEASVVGPPIESLSRLVMDARLERFFLADRVTVILDAAHNPDSIQALIATLKRRYTGRRIVGVFGTSVDKDAGSMLTQLRACFDHVILTRYHGNPRYVPTQELKTLAQAVCDDAAVTKSPAADDRWCETHEDPIQSCRNAIDSAGCDGVVVVCGSFFLAAEVRPWLARRIEA